MTKGMLVALTSVALAASSLLAPPDADADGRRDFRPDVPRLHSTPPQRFPAPRFRHDRDRDRGFHRHGVPFHRRAVPFGVTAPPFIIYTPPPAVYAVPTYTPPPVYYPPPPPEYAPPATSAPPPMETVIEYPNGRYELHGDGITTPYRWVWIPKPPAEPPPSEEAAPDVTPNATPEPREPARQTELYRWTDEAGVVHLTDRWDKVPEAYRSAMKGQR